MGKRRKKRRDAPTVPSPPTPPPRPPLPIGGWGGALAIAACAALLYAWTVGHHYVLDDLQVVRDNPNLGDAAPWAALTDSYWPAFLGTGAANWRPLATLSWWLEVGLVGRHAGPAAAAGLHHGVNALLHGAVTLALFPLARRVVRQVPLAWAACMLFAVHPAHTEVVAPCVGRTDLLAGLGGIYLLEAWCRYRCDGAGPTWLRWAVVAAAVGMGGKESAVPLLAALPLAERWIGGRSWAEVRRGALRAWAPLAALVLVYVAARIAVLGAHTVAHGQATDLGVWGRVVFAARNTVASAALLVAPVRFHHLVTTLPSDAPYTFPAPTGVRAGLWLLGALPLWFGWAALIRPSPRGAFCWVAALLAWAPTSGLLPAAAGMSLRFLFIPTAFAALGAALAAGALAARGASWRTGVTATLGVWGMVALALTAWRVPAWRDNGTFYRRLLSEAPGCYTAAYGLGSWIAQREHDQRGARAWFERALTIAGRNAQGANAWMNLAMSWEYPEGGRVRYGPGADLPRALQEYAALLAVLPDHPGAHLNAGIDADHLGRYHEAHDHFARLLELQAQHPERHAWLAKTAELANRLGQRAEACRRLREAAQAALERGLRPKAQAYLGSALQLAPTAADAAAIQAALAALGP